ncbi:unnamed protein product [Adineta ricciae]|uniref:NADP-dependent oxidoreductase domain-containing protein n=1 Tax=Adineta ricciae TaxID=249248 RepID=A0A814XSB8_ADIRI|nr:unnamed protein product [Adineta ricciae]CAF1266122.1 unnamed protein product [Adineta ricciae]
MSKESWTIESRLTLSDHHTIPRLGRIMILDKPVSNSCSFTEGLGTWRSEPGKVQNIVKEAILNHGYRHIDGAWLYKNETEVGNGIHEAIEQSQGKIKREDLFITTKLWNQHHVPEDVEWAIHDSLQKLRLDYVDLYLIHWPIAFKRMEENVWSQNEDKTVRYYAEGVTLADTWRAMEKLVDAKLVRSIGLSNFKPSEINEILQIARIKPVVNQIELHPYLNQQVLRDYCAKQDIVVTSYSPLANLKRPNEPEEEVSPLYNPTIQKIAQTKEKTAAQIILRWHLQHGLTVIPKTVTPERLHENSQVFDFELTDEEMNQIDQLEKTNYRRFFNPAVLPPADRHVFDR